MSEETKVIEEPLAKLKAQKKAAWKRWYDKHGKAYAQRRKERRILGGGNDAREDPKKP